MLARSKKGGNRRYSRKVKNYMVFLFKFMNIEDLMKHFWNNNTWEDLEDAKNKKTIIIVPIGSTEQHGLHLPVGTDSYLPFDIAKDAASKVDNIIYTMPVWTGYSPFNMYLNGTISVPVDIFYHLVESVCLSIFNHGFEKIILLNGHGGNIDILRTLSIELNSRENKKVVVFSYWDLVREYINKWRESEVGGINHACELETSLMLYKHAEIVKENKIEKNVFSPKTKYLSKDISVGDVVFMAIGFKDVSKNGTLGDPTKASKRKGERLYEKVLEKFIEFLKDFKNWDFKNIKDL